MTLVCPGIDGKGCPKHYSTDHTGDYNKHTMTCGVGPGGGGKRAGTGGKRAGTGGKRDNAGSGGKRAGTGGKRVGAGRPSKDAAEHSSSIHPKTSKEVTADSLKTIDKYFDERNMDRSTCACCNELVAPPKMKSVEPSGHWLHRLRRRLKWTHTAYKVSKATKRFYDVSNLVPALQNVPLSRHGIAVTANAPTKVTSETESNSCCESLFDLIFFVMIGAAMSKMPREFATIKINSERVTTWFGYLQQFCCYVAS
jgi:hypothetical protein